MSPWWCWSAVQINSDRGKSVKNVKKKSERERKKKLERHHLANLEVGGFKRCYPNKHIMWSTLRSSSPLLLLLRVQSLVQSVGQLHQSLILCWNALGRSNSLCILPRSPSVMLLWNHFHINNFHIAALDNCLVMQNKSTSTHRPDVIFIFWTPAFLDGEKSNSCAFLWNKKIKCETCCCADRHESDSLNPNRIYNPPHMHQQYCLNRLWAAPVLPPVFSPRSGWTFLYPSGSFSLFETGFLFLFTPPSIPPTHCGSPLCPDAASIYIEPL